MRGDRLERDLRAAVRGEVDFSTRRRAEYSADASNYRRVPRGVVFPRDVDDVVAAVAVCREHGAPLTPRGGGTSVAGNAIGEGVVLDLSRHVNRVLEVDPEAGVAVVEPGAVLDEVNRAAARHGLRVGPDPSTHARCTIGGMIGNDACGSHSIAWGRTSDAVVELDVLRYDGDRRVVGRGALPAELESLVRAHLAEIRTELGRFGRQVSGYALDRLLPENGRDLARALVGAEGTCGLVLGATLRLVEAPTAPRLVVAGYPDAVAAAASVPTVLEPRPLTCEGMDHRLAETLRSLRPGAVPDGVLPAGRAWLLLEAADDATARALATAARDAGALDAVVVTDPAAQRAVWRIREEGAGLATRLPDDSEAWPGWEDAAVPPHALADYLRDMDDLMARHGRSGLVYGHFGEGCLHTRIDFDLLTAPGRRGFRAFMEEAADLVVAHGGSLSGEHGDGQARSELLPRMYGERVLAAFAAFKGYWDPDDRMNPGVVVRPRPLDADLRVTPTRPVTTLLALRHDQGDLRRAVRRCVGVGKCRTDHGGVMCPSYRATHDEKDSTRGRARVLGEMLRGELVTGGWRSPEVREALDLCLSCKGCLVDCPVGVDMASYKSEFLHHHYRWRPRPLSHWSMGWLPLWARLASAAPGAVNAVTGSRLAPLITRAGGLAPERPLPRFADEPFRRWWRRRPPVRPTGRRVVLWVDTFTNAFVPRVGRAAVEVLEAAGFEVVVPDGSLCCGLTWVSTGQLGIARRVARRTVAALDPLLADGAPLVGLEPSCTTLLRTDLLDLLPDDERARRVAEATRGFAELVGAEGVLPGRAGAERVPSPPVLVQQHCHQRATTGAAVDVGLLRGAGYSADLLNTGCCGLAGNFGFERGHYEVSTKVAAHELLPALDRAPDATVVADGFSCRTQIEQLAGRRVVHTAEALRAALLGETEQSEVDREAGR
ncbi:FAD/FMN-containing dehydrogenase [Streptoalloteichus tenebrarius]|uniref:FAD/FMN-containing dehydrogenase n=1 Tax=Streptoalloteichus tenebrarius (strain ATCC 17920 / DSM 40477 / JCM 4838 / CBS 697.72 / NBRC 16177 / NCIMB 11028 / NRRL B-12390 / A12253. 1 / ISP 5477) TaxID=1933 RepID=A0ABT1HVE5_STRSD|nr:FAD-binding and (Fe-S)-binding domain-containing protein [Streptoalloteichus tenebrarius]MCP2259483.1 FAD/FMN-containing dehydrogenase [Streptoalloteichus tenebrarius]BFF01437.1 FAD-binding and (Fe-S)-binding domain-containing protein [Streptoalloteichus tenebrarius]